MEIFSAFICPPPIHHSSPMFLIRTVRRSDMYSLFRVGDSVAAAEAAAAQFGMYGSTIENKASWKKFADFVIEEKDILSNKPLSEIARFLSLLADQNVSIGSFWSEIFEQKLNAKISTDKTTIADLIDIISACNKVDYRPETAISKLLATLLDNETVWILSPEELVSTVKVVGNSFVQNRQFFLEVANRVIMEVDDFTDGELVAILVAFSRVNLVNSEMCKTIMKKFTENDNRLTVDDQILVAHVLSKLRFRSDTFFRSICHSHMDALGLGNLASLGMSMRMLKMDSGSTEWWDKEGDYSKIMDAVKAKSGEAAEYDRLNAKELGNVCQLAGNSLSVRTTNMVMKRIQDLLINEPLSRSHRYLASIMDGLAKGKTCDNVHVDHLRWVAEWLCGNVYILPPQDIVTINRALGKLGFRDHNYHKIWVPYYLERLSELGKDDITSISENYNAIGMSDTLLGGRHFFYKLGKRFQELSVAQTGDKQLNIERKYRNLLQRLG